MSNEYNFNEVAKNYREILNNNLGIVGKKSAYYSEFKVKKSMELIDNTLPKRILDFGCGDGMGELFLRKHFSSSEIIGVDISDESLKIARARKIKRCEFRLFTKNIPVEVNSIDFTFVACVLHHIDPQELSKIIKELINVTKPGGELHIYEHNPFNPVTRYLVNTCIFDQGAKLLCAKDLGSIIRNIGNYSFEAEYLLFFPRWRLLSPLFKYEKWLKKVPLGGQYVLRLKKD